MNATNESQPTPSRGRPRLTGERLEELLDIAAKVFIEEGFDSASTNVIARRAGASKASLYSRFPNKEQLFIAVLEHRMNRIFQAVVATIPLDAPLELALSAFGERFLQLIFNDEQMALVRLVSMESARFPQIGQRFFDLGPGRGLGALSGYISAQMERGALVAGEPFFLAQHFLGLIAGFPLLLGILGMPLRETDETHRARLESAIGMFISSFGRRDSA